MTESGGAHATEGYAERIQVDKLSGAPARQLRFESLSLIMYFCAFHILVCGAKIFVQHGARPIGNYERFGQAAAV